MAADEAVNSGTKSSPRTQKDSRSPRRHGDSAVRRRRRLPAASAEEEVIREATWRAHENAARNAACETTPSRPERPIEDLVLEVMGRVDARAAEDPAEAMRRADYRRHWLISRGVFDLHADVDLTRPPTHFPRGYHDLAAHLPRLLTDIEASKRGGPIAAILGPVGVGKTALGCGLLRYSYDLGRPYVFYTPALLYLQRSLNSSRERRQAMFRNYCRADALVLDDLHDQGQSAWASAEIRLLVDVRYGQRKPTLLISNLDVKKFTQEVGPQVHRRIAETGDFHACLWPRLLSLPNPSHGG